jgi:beta-lactamase class C
MTRRELLSGSLALALRRGATEEAAQLIDERVRSGEVAAAVLHVRSAGKIFERAFGKARRPDAVFLIASITKPMTVTAVMLMADRGELKLTDPVQRYIPEFREEGREAVQIRHLITHTSGLPDMLPENEALRKRHAPLSDFVAGSCRTPLLFRPGTEMRYQSMGILLASEIVSRITGQRFPELLKSHVFEPMGMRLTSLGLGGRAISETMLCQVPQASDWDWNSPYWRNLGAPWGGAHSTAGDISRLLQYFAEYRPGVLKRETAAAMIVNQNRGLNRAWGYGWMVGSEGLGKGCSERSFGHSGSTGTLCWFDRQKDTAFVLLTTKPADVSNAILIRPVSDLVSQASL